MVRIPAWTKPRILDISKFPKKEDDSSRNGVDSLNLPSQSFDLSFYGDKSDFEEHLTLHLREGRISCGNWRSSEK